MKITYKTVLSSALLIALSCTNRAKTNDLIIQQLTQKIVSTNSIIEASTLMITQTLKSQTLEPYPNERAAWILLIAQHVHESTNRTVAFLENAKKRKVDGVS